MKYIMNIILPERIQLVSLENITNGICKKQIFIPEDSSTTQKMFIIKQILNLSVIGGSEEDKKEFYKVTHNIVLYLKHLFPATILSCKEGTDKMYIEIIPVRS